MIDWEGNIMHSSKLDLALHRLLPREHEKGMEFPPETKSTEHIKERFAVFSFLRRASDASAINMKISSNDIDAVNRWKKLGSAKDKAVSAAMMHCCADFL